MLQINKKEEIVNDMKIYSEIFNDMGELEFLIPAKATVPPVAFVFVGLISVV